MSFVMCDGKRYNIAVSVIRSYGLQVGSRVDHLALASLRRNVELTRRTGAQMMDITNVRERIPDDDR